MNQVVCTPDRFGSMVGASGQMKDVYSFIEKAAPVDLPVLIIGETGTGKELVAQEIHRLSHRSEGPFVPVNIGALPRELVTSELFGHRKGSFTGATHERLGRFGEAHRGSLFLDEISSIDEYSQIALLRVLECRQYRQLGSDSDRDADVRLIAAANVDPMQHVRNGRFRQDLLQRLEVLRVVLPPLRKRQGDIPALVRHFLKMCGSEFDTRVTGVASEAMELLKQYPWPGNVRELKNVIAQACVFAESGEVGIKHLPSRIASPERDSRIAELQFSPSFSSNNDVRAFPSSNGSQMPVSVEWLPLPLGISLEEVNRAYVSKTLAFCGNNKTLAAKRLGISRKSLYDKMARWNME